MAEQQKRDAIFGHFGYKVFSDEIIVPFVYRSDAHLFSMTMLQRHLPLKEPDIEKIEYLKNQLISATRKEVTLLQEINLVHNDGYYPRISYFEKLLRIEDATQIVKFQIDCVNAKKGFSIECGGFVRFALTDTDDKEYVLPYYVKNGKKVTPVDLVKKITQSKQAWNIVGLKNVEVLYMKILISLCSCDLEISESTLNCVTIDDLTKDCSRVKEYWPKSFDSIENTVTLSTKTTTNNNKSQNEYVVRQTSNKTWSIQNLMLKLHGTEIRKVPTGNTTTNNNERKTEDVVIPAPNTSTNNNKPNNEDAVISTINTSSKNIKRKHENVETSPVSKSTKSKKEKHENGDNLTASKGKNNKNRRIDDDSDEELEDDVFVVEMIIKCRPKNGGQALVRWKGYSSDEDTWEPLENLNDSLKKQARKMLSKKRN